MKEDYHKKNVFKLTLENVDAYKADIKTMLNQSCKKSFPDIYFDDVYFCNRIELLKNYIKEGKAIVYAVKNEVELEGFVWFFEKCKQENRIIHINHFVVKEKYRSLGIGNKLLNQIENYAAKKGIKEIELFVTKKNNEAVKFYEGKSFEVERLLMKKRFSE